MATAELVLETAIDALARRTLVVANLLGECRRALGAPPPAEHADPLATDYRDRHQALTGRSLRQCPQCHDGNMQLVDHLADAWVCPAILDSS